MSSPSWGSALPKYHMRRNADTKLASNMWTTMYSSALFQNASEHEIAALMSLRSAVTYTPFFFEGNAFFEAPLTKAQLTMRATERMWTNPVWLRADSLPVLRLQPAPLEAPIAVWLPQCGDEFRPLASLPPKVQSIILRDQPMMSYIQDTSHVILSLDYVRAATELGGLPDSRAAPKLSVMSRPQYSWQHVTPQFAHFFDHAWSICEPQVAPQVRKAIGSRDSTREVPPAHPRKKLWVSLRAARAMHAEARHAFYSLPYESITVTTPSHGGLFYNVAQIFPSTLLQQKTDEVLQLIADMANDSRPAKVVEAIPQLGNNGQLSATASAWRRFDHPYAVAHEQPTLDLNHSASPAAQDDIVVDERHPIPETDMDAMMLFADDEIALDHTDEAYDAHGGMGVVVDEVAANDCMHNMELTAESEIVEAHKDDDDVIDPVAELDMAMDQSDTSVCPEQELLVEVLDQVRALSRRGELPVEVEPDAQHSDDAAMCGSDEPLASEFVTLHHHDPRTSFHSCDSMFAPQHVLKPLHHNDMMASLFTSTPFECGGAA